MQKLVARIRSFVRNEDGPTATEYAITLGLLVVIAVGAASTFSGSIGGLFQSVASATSGAGIVDPETARGPANTW